MRWILKKGLFGKVTTTVSSPFHPSSQTIGLLMYTSGTTGKPKGVMLTYQSVSRGAVYFLWTCDHRERSRIMRLPIYHINGLCVTVMGTLVSASTGDALSVFGLDLLRALCDTPATVSAVPTQYAYILNNDAPVEDLSHLRFARSASAPLSPDIHRRFEERFKVPLSKPWGSPKRDRRYNQSASPAERKIGSPGAAYGNEIMVADAGFAVPTGQTGEILVRGKNVMQKSLKQPGRPQRRSRKTDGCGPGILGIWMMALSMCPVASKS